MPKSVLSFSKAKPSRKYAALELNPYAGKNVVLRLPFTEVLATLFAALSAANAASLLPTTLGITAPAPAVAPVTPAAAVVAFPAVDNTFPSPELPPVHLGTFFPSQPMALNTPSFAPKAPKIPVDIHAVSDVFSPPGSSVAASLNKLVKPPHMALPTVAGSKPWMKPDAKPFPIDMPSATAPVTFTPMSVSIPPLSELPSPLPIFSDTSETIPLPLVSHHL